MNKRNKGKQDKLNEGGVQGKMSETENARSEGLPEGATEQAATGRVINGNELMAMKFEDSAEKPALTYKNLLDMKEEMAAMNTLPPDERSVSSKSQMFNFLKEAISEMFEKGYSHDAIADYINKRQKDYVVNRREIKKLLAPPEEALQAPRKRRTRKQRNPETQELENKRGEEE